MKPIHVLKFGGTSLQDASFIQQAAEIIVQKSAEVRPAVVVSAVAGVTDQLAHLADHISPGSVEASALIDQLKLQHLTILEQLSVEEDRDVKQFSALFDALHQAHSKRHSKPVNVKARRDEILSIGERASGRLLSVALNKHRLPNQPFDAHHFIKTDANFGAANVNRKLTNKSIRQVLRPLDKIPVITGFIGSTDQNEITTLGRSGSDYTAGLIADALEAEHLEIWTDVDGVLTAHPDVVPTAQSIEQLSFKDVAELAEHGMGVIHPKTIQPIQNRNISLQVRNSYNVDHPGTQITKSYSSNGDFRSVTVTGPFVYLQTDEAYASSLSRLLDERKSRTADTEAFGYRRPSRYEPAQFLIKQSFFDQIKPAIQKWSEQIPVILDIQRNIYKVKKFTNRLQQSDESFNQLINALHQHKIQPLRIGREHNQRHIQFLLTQKQAYEAAQAINDYWADGRKNISLFIAGTGAVGGTLIEQVGKLNHPDLKLRVIGTCNSKQTKWSDPDKTQPTEWTSIIAELAEHKYANTVFVDATGSKEVARLYPKLFDAGIHVITPSKLANTFDQDFYERLHQSVAQNEVKFRYETTVGAGLPVISTLNDLVESGDHITKLSGVVSGTMTYLFEQLEQGTPFSEAIIKARELGYAEPNPRDDLSGEDVARKFLTLARELGLKIERDQLQVESLVPRELLSVDRSTFLALLPDYNDIWKDRFQTAKKQHKTLRYVGTLSEGQVSIQVKSVPGDSPLGLLRGTDNLLQIYSRHYHKTPLVIQGAGAGKQVTAAGVLSDVLKVAEGI